MEVVGITTVTWALVSFVMRIFCLMFIVLVLIEICVSFLVWQQILIATRLPIKYRIVGMHIFIVFH